MFYRTDSRKLKLSILLTCFIWIYVESLRVIPVHTNVTFYNKKYFKNVFTNVRRYSRQSPYYVNFWAETKKTIGNDMMVDIIFKDSRHIGRSFYEYHIPKLCDFVNNNCYMLKMFPNYHCPYLPGEYNFMNITVSSENFPTVFPFRESLVNFAVSIAATK